MIRSCANLALTWQAGITFAGLISCSAISCRVPRFISTRNIFALYPQFNLKAFERQQLYEIWPYMGSVIICLFVCNPILSLSNSSSFKVYLNYDVTMYGYFGCPCLSMKSISSSQCLISVYNVWSWFVHRIISSQLDTQRITTLNIVFRKSVRWPRAYSPTCSLKSITRRMLPCLSIFLGSWISRANFVKNISTHCW